MRLFLLTLAAAGLALGSAGAHHCVPTTSTPFAEAAGFYVAGKPHTIILCDTTCLIDFWVYEESNGIPGLQRGDEIVDDTCGGHIASDSILF